jgi:hypothetical protein
MSSGGELRLTGCHFRGSEGCKGRGREWWEALQRRWSHGRRPAPPCVARRRRRRQGCNPAIPSTCCKACEETDGCNAWVVCTNKVCCVEAHGGGHRREARCAHYPCARRWPRAHASGPPTHPALPRPPVPQDGCGSGCQAYAKQFKGPLSYSDKLPHQFWGNWGSCQGDKWAFGMCSLKIVQDTKNPPVPADSSELRGRGLGAACRGLGCPRCHLGAPAPCFLRLPLWPSLCAPSPQPPCPPCPPPTKEPSDGWVSGIVPKTQHDPRCPVGVSAKTCKTCLTAKDPALCISCVNQARTLDAAPKCAACASLASEPGRAGCVQCMGGTAAAAAECRRCLDVDCGGADCLNAQNFSPASAPNLGSVDKCFACQSAAGLSSAKAAGCPRCFDTYTVPEAGRGTCLSCVGTASAAGALGCAGCAGAPGGGGAACLACLAKAKTPADGAGCGSCSTARDAVPHAAACHECVLNSQADGAKNLCSNLQSGAAASDVAAFYKCLAAAKGEDAPHNCWMCSTMGNAASAAKCYECVNKVRGRGTGVAFGAEGRR